MKNLLLLIISILLCSVILIVTLNIIDISLLNRGTFNGSYYNKVVYYLENKDHISNLVPSIYHNAIAYESEEQLSTINNQKIVNFSNKSNSTVITCKEDQDFILNESDEFGFNNKRGMYQDVDVILIGDSFTEGYCVPQQDNIAGHLNQSQIKTINLGRAASGPLTELAIIREYALPLQPKNLVILFYPGNDIDELNIESEMFTMNYLTDDKYSFDLFHRVKENDKLIDQIITLYTGEQFEPLQKKNQQIYDQIFDPMPLFDKFKTTLISDEGDEKNLEYDNDSMIVYEYIIEKIKHLLKDTKITYVYLSMPQDYTYKNTTVINKNKQRIQEIITRQGIPFIDIAKHFKKSSQDPIKSFFATQLWQIYHYNKAGYQVVAEAIKEELLKQGVKPRGDIYP